VRSRISDLNGLFDRELSKVKHTEEVNFLRVKYLGRKGCVQSLMLDLRNCAPDERPKMGKLINGLKREISEKLDAQYQIFSERELSARLDRERVDVALPGRRAATGRAHPLMHMLNEVVEILGSMGFSVQCSSEIESEYYTYGGLNYPPDHPARDMQDTLYITPDILLRSHTTSIQQHIMESVAPPIRILSGGRCYRNETITARSHIVFHQVDVLYIDKGVTFADLLATKEEFYSKIFGQKVETRVRPSYFPFVEPGMEVDIRCNSCGGVGCHLCKGTGWVEVCGAGMVHPEVLQAGGVDPEIYSGYAWGGGIERLLMLRHNIDDIRLLSENDMRFLSQFP